MNRGGPFALRPAAAPAAILVAVALALWVGPTLPPSLAGLKVYGAYLALAAAAAMALWFNRGRAFIAAASLLLAYAAYRYALSFGPQTFTARAVYTAITILVPLNALVALALPERGVSHHGDHRWLFVGAGEIVLVAWIAAAGRSDLSGAAWQRLLDHWLFASPPAPLLGRIAFGAAVAAAIARAWPRKTIQFAPLETGLAGALIAFHIACEWPGSRVVFGAFCAAAGAILVVAMLQESHRMAFRDELTGLPGRRALEETLAGLGPRYAVAMVDVDHFKQFNDTHGHDVGDQVLKLVAARLAECGGGGRAFRYGGEEFTLVFPSRALEEAMPHLEAARAGVEGYPMAVRSGARPRDIEEGTRHRGEGAPQNHLAVTVSIGAAEPDARAVTPAQVVKAADAALYRAKKGGRNRVCR